MATWTAERIEQVKSCFRSGLPASETATVVGVTRNAVIGKWNRMGLFRARGEPKKPRRARPGNKSGAIGRAAVARIKRPKPEFMPAEVPFVSALNPDDIPRQQRRDLFRLRDPNPRTGFAGDCRWPYGEPGRADFFFCGGEAKPGMSYCAMHCRAAVNPCGPVRRPSA